MIVLICGYSWWQIGIICIGVFIASFVDAIGGGGGLISLPTYLLTGLPMHFALGTNKLSSCLGTTASTFRYIKQGYVKWELAIPSAILALAGAHIGTSLQLVISDTILKYVLTVVLIFIAVILLKKKRFDEEPGTIKPALQWVIVLSTSLIIGTYDGIYGPGTGTLLLICYCKFAKLGLKNASGNLKIVNLSSNIGALATSLIAGKVLIPIGLIAAIFSFAGQFIGSGVMIKKGTKIVSPIILIVLLLLIAKVIFELFGIKFPQ